MKKISLFVCLSVSGSNKSFLQFCTSAFRLEETWSQSSSRVKRISISSGFRGSKEHHFSTAQR